MSGFLPEPKLPKKLRLLVCGDRDWEDHTLVYNVLNTIHKRIAVIIEGEARGADTFAREWAENFPKPFLPFPAKWTELGRAAGPIRNQQMIDEGKPDYVIAFHDNFEASKGTADMIKKAIKARIPFAIISHKNKEFKLP